MMSVVWYEKYGSFQYFIKTGEDAMNDNSGTSLIQPGVREKVRALIGESKTEVALRRRKERLEPLTAGFARLFTDLCARYFLIPKNKLANRSDEELRELERLIASHSLRTAAILSVLTLSNPIGWVVYLNQVIEYSDHPKAKMPRPGLAWSYRSMRSELTRFLGKEWIPYDAIRRSASSS